MAPNEHLLDNFSTSKETRTLGVQILRLAHAKTGQGSGRELRELRVGLPAASVLIACEQLNNTEVNKKAAQSASCLKDRDFKKVYDTVRAIVDENKRASNATYEGLHKNFNSGIKFDSLREFIVEVESEVVIRTGHGPESNLTRCVVYFWVLNCVKPTVLPGTEAFAQLYDLSLKKFITTLDALNEHCKPLRKKIVARFKESALQVTPRRSPRKPLVSPAKGSASKVEILSNELPAVQPEKTPTRRSTRTTTSIYGGNVSPTKSPLPPPWKKGPIRVLPSKDSPEKQGTERRQKSITSPAPDKSPHTPSKRRRIDFEEHTAPELTSAFHAALNSTPQHGSVAPSPSKTPTVVRVSSRPLKRKYTVAIPVDVSSESEESELEALQPRGRFRPVYLEQKQWAAQDPLVASIWKRLERSKALEQDGLKSSPRRRKT